jgi:hypothetical protein
MEGKKFYQSKTTYGLAMIILGIWLNSSGIPLDSPEAVQAAEELTGLLTKAGIGLAAWGRAVADKKLTM